MPLTNAQLQARHRAKRKAQLQRYEAALREIANNPDQDASFGNWYQHTARAALQEPSDAE